MQSGDQRSRGPDSAIEDPLLGSRGTALKYLLPEREGGGGDRREGETVKGLAKPNELEICGLLLLPSSLGVRQRPFARPYIPIILSKRPGARKPIIAFLTECHRGE